jgi:DNA-binding NarL/FixJ family response regulator
MSRTIRVLIADDHEVLREGARGLIEEEEGWEVCGIACNGREAVEMAKTLKPDVVLLDMTMPEISGIDATRLIKKALPETEIVIFSAHASEQVIEQAFEAGVKSYIKKADAARDLVSAIRSAAEHKPFFTPEISEIIFAKFLNPSAKSVPGQPQHELTAREREILRLLAEGGSNKEIAKALGISVRTAETHRATLMRKCGLDSLAAIVRYAIRNSIIEP